MPRFLLHHRHEPGEVRRRVRRLQGPQQPAAPPTTRSRSCRRGGHEIWWLVEADSAEKALDLLPAYVADRSTAIPIREVQIP